jgi:hypothetical protein
LKLGVRNSEVKNLQVFLNADADTRVAVSGAGSSGNETTYFGAATQSAVKKFQTKYGISPVAGYWGSISRAKANELLNAGTTTTPTTTPTTTDCSNGAAFDPVTGQPCTTSTIPGCLPGYAFSSTTGQSCTGGATPTTEPTTTVPTTGTLSVALAANNPASSTLITGQSIADLAHFTIANGSSSEVKITTVELQRLGVSADATLANVYLFDDATRLTDAGTVSSGKVTFNSTTGVIVIPANSSKVISVRADIANNSNGQTVGVALSGLTSSLQLAGTLPINGNIHSIANANLATVTFGTVLGTSLMPGNTNSDPTTGVVVWQNNMNIGNRNVIFNKISLKQINSVEAKDISNFKLEVDGTQVATIANLDSNGYITFSGLNKTLTTGNRTVKVIADIVGGSGRIAQFSVRNKADVEFKDSEYGALIAATNVPSTAGTITINNGTMSVSKASDSVSGKIANNGSNISLAKYEFKAYGEPIKVETLTTGFAYTSADGSNGGAGANAGTATIRNGKVYVNGAQVGSTTTIAKAGTQFTTNFVVTPGTTTIVEIYGDVFDNDGAGALKNGDTLKFKLVTGVSNASKQVSYGTTNVPGSDVDGNQVTVSEGDVTLTKSSSYANQNVVLPQNDYKIGQWNIAGSATENVNITTLGVDLAGNTVNFDADNVKNAYLKITKSDGTVTDLTIKSSMITNDNNWPVSITLEKNKNMTVALYGRLELNPGPAAPGNTLTSTLDVAGSGADSGAPVSKTTAGQTLTYAAGALNVTRAASSPVSAIVDDSGTVITASYKFEAQSDSYIIEELYVNIGDASAVTNVSLKDGDTVLKTMPAAANMVFGGLNISVPANESKTIDIVLEMTTVGTGAGTSGAALTTNIQNATGLTYRSSSTGEGAVVSTAAVTAGNAIYTYKSFPSLAVASLSSTDLTAGTKTLSKFTVTSNGGAVSWKQMVFSMTKSATVEIANTAGALDATKLSVVDTSTGLAIGGAFTTVGNDCAVAANTTCGIAFVPTIEEAVSGTKTYELRGAISGALVTNNYVTTEIKASGNGYVAPAAFGTVQIAGSNFIWSDVSKQSHDATTLDWNNDNLLKTLPISQTLTNRN